MKQPTRTYHLAETGEIISLLERTERLLTAIERVDALCRQPPCVSLEQRDRLIAALLEEQEREQAKGGQ